MNQTRRFRLLAMLILCLSLLACRKHFSQGASFPAIAHDPVNGRYLSVYLKVLSGSQDAGGTGDSRLYGAFIDSSGSLQGTEFLISEEPDYYYCPSIVFDRTHMQYLVVWANEDFILGQFIQSDGSLAGGRLTLSNTASSDCGRCVAASYNDAARLYLAAWGEPGVAEHDGVYARLINPDGSFLGPKLPLSDDGAAIVHPSIASDDVLSRFLVVWNSEAYRAVKGRMVNVDGTFAASEFLISSTTGTYAVPSVVYNSVDARYLVSWDTTTCGCRYDLQGQFLNSDGTPFQSVIAISSAGRNAWFHSSAYNAADNTYLFVFGDYTGKKDLLYTQVVKSDGTLDTAVANDSIPISYDKYPYDTRPAVAFDGINDSFFALWQYGKYHDSSGAFSDIHGRLINADGTPGGDISVVSNGGVW